MFTIAAGIVLAVVFLNFLPLLVVLVVMLAIVVGVALLLLGSTAIAWAWLGPLAAIVVFIGGCLLICHLSEDRESRSRARLAYDQAVKAQLTAAIANPTTTFSWGFRLARRLRLRQNIPFTEADHANREAAFRVLLGVDPIRRRGN